MVGPRGGGAALAAERAGARAGGLCPAARGWSLGDRPRFFLVGQISDVFNGCGNVHKSWVAIDIYVCYALFVVEGLNMTRLAMFSCA